MVFGGGEANYLAGCQRTAGSSQQPLTRSNRWLRSDELSWRHGSSCDTRTRETLLSPCTTSSPDAGSSLKSSPVSKSTSMPRKPFRVWIHVCLCACCCVSSGSVYGWLYIQVIFHPEIKRIEWRKYTLLKEHNLLVLNWCHCIHLNTKC